MGEIMAKKRKKITQKVQNELSRYFQHSGWVGYPEKSFTVLAIKRLRMLCEQYVKFDKPRVHVTEYLNLAHAALCEQGLIKNPKKGQPKTKKGFYHSSEWQRIRYQALKFYERKCMCCGRNPDDHGIVLHVDHIKARSLYPELALHINNLQILCEDCNLGKSNTDEIDYRPKLRIV